MSPKEVKNNECELIMLIKEMRHSNQNIQNTYECFVERIQQISKLKKYSSL